MTIEEAIEQLKRSSKLNEFSIRRNKEIINSKDFNFKNIISYKMAEKEFLNENVVYEIAIKALEKQAPKKLVRFNENFYTFYTCPDCMKYFNGMVKPRYCSGCGQALDWGDNDA